MASKKTKVDVPVTLDEDTYTAHQLLNTDLGKIAHLWDPYFRKAGLGALIGSSDSGKSLFCRQMAHAVISNQAEFLGHKLSPCRGAVLYVSSEDDAYATAEIIKKQFSVCETADEQLKNLHFLFNVEKIDERIESFISKTPVDLVVLDSYGDLFMGGDANANTQVRNFLKRFTRLAQKHDCYFLFIHHVSKKGDGNDASKHNALGSQGFEAKMRIVFELRTRTDYKKTLTVVKGNYLGQEHKRSSCLLELNEETLTFSVVAARVPLDEGSSMKVSKKKATVNWDDIIRVGEKEKAKMLIEKLVKRHGIGNSTARRYITAELTPLKDEPGFYTRLEVAETGTTASEADDSSSSLSEAA